MKDKIEIRDIHPEGVAEEFDRLMQLDIDDLRAHESEFSDTCCPACHGSTVPHAFVHQSLNYRRCSECETLYISPGPIESLHLDFVRKSRAMAFWRERLPAQMRETRKPMYRERADYAADVWARMGIKPATTFEFGAGNGEFAEELAARNIVGSIVLLEPQALKLGLPNVEILTEGFEALMDSARQFDTVFAWELIEHVVEPDMFLRAVRQVLKPGAPFILSTPNERSVETRMLGRNSSNILFDHVRLYNPLSIRTLLERNGFRVVEICTPGKLDVARIQSCLDRRSETSGSDVAMRLILGDAVARDDLQRLLQANLLSSHMRVVAVADGDWRGAATPRLVV
ncbi:MAG: class I SAM-dependent methyltransferase [Gammaproteobacteria bacterium]|nr:class I SAM-dependent methyltransferase [Gammaproteobacteria bacterium]MBU0769887.1 class I SAM-dependent methyltransferase [Gammaproteobacteria bacterium]MBU0854692.1 class I SAM-dependent methyltransferase [Gammaproteobacteria bacterium]MBU1845435.1 class I SAM-dependent methyltransferase [Gammaproteobacteria bacterium]